MDAKKGDVGVDAETFDRIIGELVPFVKNFDLTLERLEGREGRLRLRYTENLVRPGGTVSGPAIMAMADLLLYAMVLRNLGMVELAVTTDLNFHFLRRPAPRDMIAEGKLLKLGRRLAVGEVTFFTDGDSEPVAHATGTYSIPPPKAG